MRRGQNRLDITMKVMIELGVVGTVDRRSKHTTIVVLALCSFVPFLSAEDLLVILLKLDTPRV